ncbi:MAG TPA: hypothetical protein P5280_01135 [Cyclobacteriaceae bacterium]|nr:hypothetical protein [Cyclobacteriaceae bacterium]
MRKIQFLLTFDYELPLGYCTDYQSGLFNPTDKLLECAKTNDFPIVLFADICSAIRFKEWDHAYYTSFRRQIHDALLSGNDVQLHVHPHWMNSTFSDGQFQPSNDFSLSSFKDHKDISISYILQTAFDELTSMARDANRDYRCVAFRAGGYDVEPASKEILSELIRMGIFFESSVIKNLFLNNEFSKIDYRTYPDKSIWAISPEGPINREGKGDLLELPITSMPTTARELLRRWLKKLSHQSAYAARRYDNKGGGYHNKVSNVGLKQKLSYILNPLVLSVDKSNYDVDDLMRIVNYNLKKFREQNEDLILTLIGHPKSMGEYHRSLLAAFVETLRRTYQDSVRFVTYRDIQNEFR